MTVRKEVRSEKSQVLGIRRGVLTERIEAIRQRKSEELGVEMTTPQILTMLVACYENQEKRKR